MTAGPTLTQIRASAGSGKTWRLTADYIEKLIRLGDIDEKARPVAAASILAVTFTNAAANEMRARVIKRLKEEALTQGAGKDGINAEQARAWLDVFLKDLDALDIRTIDSLLNQIVRASALDLKISPDYEIQFDAASALEPLVEMFLEQARDNGAQRELVAGACRAVREFGSHTGFTARGSIMEGINSLLGSAAAGKLENLDDVEEIRKVREALPKRLSDAAGKLLDLAESENLQWQSRTKAIVEKYRDLNFTKNISAYAQKANAGEIFKNSFSQDAESAWQEFRKAAEAYYFGSAILERAALLAPLVKIANYVAGEFMNNQAELGIELQARIPAWASEVLSSKGGVSDALVRLGSRLTHFLVDEFQDTSREQWQVLRALALDALARGGSLTFVGDAKQSIYSWRGGDPRLFDSVLTDSDLSAIVPDSKSLQLGSNWRSLPAIVDHTNRFFAPFADPDFARQAAIDALGEDAPKDLLEKTGKRLFETFREVSQKCIKKDGASGFVQAEEIGGEYPDAIDQRIVQLLLDDISSRRPWSHVLILVRGNDEAGRIAAALGANRIPAITENGLLLAENALVIEVLAFLSFLNNPRDDIAFWTFVKGAIFSGHPLAGPVARINLPDWAAGREGGVPLYRNFSDDFPEVWKELVRPFFNRAGILTAYDAIREWYRRMGVENRFAEDSTMLQRLLETAHLAENRGMASIAAFLEYWRKNSQSEKAPMPENMNACRIMTIHKAKGLEAPVVIAPCPEYRFKVSKDPKILQFGNLKVAANLLKDFGRPYYEDLARQGLETLNLLYVALTRAEEELYLLFAEKRKGKHKTIRNITRALLKKAGFALPYTCGEKPPPNPEHIPELVENPSRSESLPASASKIDWRPLEWMPRLKIYRAGLTANELTPRQRGIALHSCLEFMNPDGDPAAAAEAALKCGLANSAVFVPDSEKAKMLDILSWFAQAVPIREWLKKGWREQPLVNAEGEILRADLIVPENWGPLVVDYKSGEPGQKDVSQIREYMKVLAESGQFPGVPRGLLIYLDRKEFKKVAPKRGINLVKSYVGKSDQPRNVVPKHRINLTKNYINKSGQSRSGDTLVSKALPPLP